ncbi:hypothetical protein [Streptomyces sp. NPDC057682]|uniref:hypothetical protein n=1 Tax=Streptomyces sp. NPDC057682 TaxID=3346210 RepID=UPI0036A3EAF6
MSRRTPRRLATTAALTVAVLCGTGLAATAAPAHSPAVAPGTPPPAASSTPDGLRFDSGWTAEGWYLPPDVYIVYCFIHGETRTANGRTSNVWLLVKYGNTRVWVNKIYLSAADYNVGLPRC